jgi:hypothetical protein
VRAVVDQLHGILPNLTVVRRDVHAWIAANGLPSDLVPYTSDHLGQCISQAPRLVPLQACCWANIMQPLHERIKADGNTLVIRGTKRADMKRLPMQSGQVLDGIELLLPLEHWTNADVMAYLREQGAPIAAAYDYFEDMADCATCSAWWGEKRAAFLRQRHPELFHVYRARMAAVLDAVGPVTAALASELKELGRMSGTTSGGWGTLGASMDPRMLQTSQQMMAQKLMDMGPAPTANSSQESASMNTLNQGLRGAMMPQQGQQPGQTPDWMKWIGNSVGNAFDGIGSYPAGPI